MNERSTETVDTTPNAPSNVATAVAATDSDAEQNFRQTIRNGNKIQVI